VTAFRLVPKPRRSSVGEDRGDTLVEGPGRACPLAWRDFLLPAFRAADFESPALGVVSTCICVPEVRIVFAGAGPDVRVTLCYECGTIALESAGAGQVAFFGGGRDRLLDLAYEVFADDAELARAGKRRP
jgi:hypothetical protein